MQKTAQFLPIMPELSILFGSKPKLYTQTCQVLQNLTGLKY
jgi:hypothetical protein